MAATTIEDIFNSADEASPGHYGVAKTALLLLDFHALFVNKMGGPNGPAALEAAVKLRNWARAQGIVIVHVLVDGRKGPFPTCKTGDRIRKIVAEMSEEGGGGEEAPELRTDIDEDVTFYRRPGYVSALECPDIDTFLQMNNVKSIVLAGLSTSGCVLSTALAAVDGEFVVTVISDACADPVDGLHEIIIENVLKRRAHVTTVAEFQQGFEKFVAPK